MNDHDYDDAREAILADALSTIVEHWDGMTTRPGLRPRGGRRPAPASTPPVNLDITAVRASTDTLMRQMAQMLLEVHPDARPGPEASGPEMADHLWAWVRELAEIVATEDADTLARHAARVLHWAAPTRPDWMRVGTCPLLLEDGATCGGEVRGWPHWTDEDGTAWCECRGCGTKEVASWWEARGMGAVGDVLTTDEVCALAWSEFGRSLPSVTVRRWVHEGRIAPLSAGARPLKFRREDVVRTLAVMC